MLCTMFFSTFYVFFYYFKENLQNLKSIQFTKTFRKLVNFFFYIFVYTSTQYDYVIEGKELTTNNKNIYYLFLIDLNILFIFINKNYKLQNNEKLVGIINIRNVIIISHEV